MTETGNSTVTTEYAGNYIYEGNALQFFNHTEGYVEPDGSNGYNYIYQYKDHLGNIRLSYTDISTTSTPNLEIVEENNYYPFGLKHKGYGAPQGAFRDHKYGFGGKEEQDELSLGWIDITARNYDPALGRWMNVDPLAEDMRRHSPYNYAFNNPLRFIDSDGMAPFDLIVKGDVAAFQEQVQQSTGGFYNAVVDKKEIFIEQYLISGALEDYLISFFVNSKSINKYHQTFTEIAFSFAEINKSTND